MCGADTLGGKQARLEAILRDLGGVVVAFSGGVDSAYLLAAAFDVLGDRCVAATAVSPSLARDELAAAERIAAALGARHVRVDTQEFEDARYLRNDVNRCYFCKHALFTELAPLAGELGLPAVVYGANADDRGDYRPGRRAAREFGVWSPLDEAGLSKADIRALSHEAGLPTWDEPASACLSSRIPYYSEVTNEKLRAIEQAEEALRGLGFRVVRVRHHDTVARIELGRDEMPRALEPPTAAAIDRELRALGFRYVTLDLGGYRLGSLNEGLRLKPI